MRFSLLPERGSLVRRVTSGWAFENGVGTARMSVTYKLGDPRQRDRRYSLASSFTWSSWIAATQDRTAAAEFFSMAGRCANNYARRKMINDISGGTPSRTGAPTVPSPRLT